jgi:hypothetical protein
MLIFQVLLSCLEWGVCYEVTFLIFEVFLCKASSPHETKMLYYKLYLWQYELRLPPFKTEIMLMQRVSSKSCSLLKFWIMLKFSLCALFLSCSVLTVPNNQCNWVCCNSMSHNFLSCWCGLCCCYSGDCFSFLPQDRMIVLWPMVMYCSPIDVYFSVDTTCSHSAHCDNKI